MGKLFTGWLMMMGVLVQNLDAKEGVTVQTVEPVQGSTILVLGDSLSAAWGIDQHQGWVELLRHRLVAEGLDFQVINGSVSGETTSGGLGRLAPLLEQYRPAIVVVELGANDGLQGLSLDSMEANLHRIIDQVEAIRGSVLLTGMRIPPNLGPVYSKMFVDVYQRVADKRKVSFLPFFLQDVATVAELNQADGLHPNAAAQPIILANLWIFLEALMARS